MLEVEMLCEGWVTVAINEIKLKLKVLRAIFCFNQKTAYEMRISDWSSDVCSSDLPRGGVRRRGRRPATGRGPGVAWLFRLCTDVGWHVQIGRASCRERVCQYV